MEESGNGIFSGRLESVERAFQPLRQFIKTRIWEEKRMKKKNILILVGLLVLALVVGLTSADDGAMFRRNISKTPLGETERAVIVMMTFYVPAQSSDGTLLLDDGIDETREFAKPLVAVYIDGIEEEHEEEDGDDIIASMSGAGFGEHDAYAALSLDDGDTWKRTNLSMSADLSSFTLANGEPYPGDAHNMTFAVADDKVLVGWISKYCDGGSPAYTWLDENGNDLYPDIWGVAGSQSSVDYTLQGYPEVGEMPYSCVWSARGTLLEDPDTGLYDIIWTKAERLTSGRRDANRLEMNADSAAGFMMTWQEDPEGLRPGQGLGPGEGWSGAVVNQQTDLWYSYISNDDFVWVQTSDEDVTPVSIYEYTGETMPKVAAPLALPVRLTDNKMCKATGSDPYCYIDFSDVDGDGNLILPDDLGTIVRSPESTFCHDIFSWLNPGGSTTLDLCVAQDGRVMQGRVGASRPRVNVQPYDSDGNGVYDSAWVIMGAEESKALGEGSTELDVEPEDLGKNMWYYSFDMLNPDVVRQGGMLNQPAINPETSTFFPLLEDDFGNFFYETEIARRFSHFSQPIHQIGDSGVSAVLIVKQGILNQGGPADIFLQRLVFSPDDVQVLDFVYDYPEVCTGVFDLDDVDDEDDDSESLANINGKVVDDAETGLACVSVELSDDTNQYTVNTDANGDYLFRDAQSGVYTVTVPSDLLAYDPPDPVTATVTVIVGFTGTETVGDFIYTPSGVCTGFVDLDGVEGDHISLVDISGTVTSQYDAGLACVSVDLILDGEVVETVYTNVYGEYLFQDAGPGDYTVQVTDENAVLADYTPPASDTLPADVPVENPYAYENMACDEWVYTDGSNPRYLEGLCLGNMINVSGGTIVSCENNTSGGTCADAFPWDGGVTPFPKVTEWVQTEENLDDQSWENPYDVSKGHRGFIDGDFIMMMYAWSPNWQANSVGNDHYNLYARRSFDGGLTWTTTPGGDGACHTETYLSDTGSLETCYGAGLFEQSRNLSQLIGNKVTVLDPRYTPTGGIKMLPITDKFELDDALPYLDDLERDPSKFFIVYETGDNTTVATGEAVPLDLFYSRATAWGDDYDVVDYYNATTNETSVGFDWLEHDREILSGEASITANNGGTFFYNVWNQWQEDEHENAFDSDIWFRRVMYLDEEEDEAVPTADIVFTSHSAADYSVGDLRFVGLARDNDSFGEGIVSYAWYSSIDGLISTDQIAIVPVTALSEGFHTITFVVEDGEGNTAEDTTTFFLADPLYQIMLPVVQR